MSEDAADPELREVAGQAHASLLRVKGHASAGEAGKPVLLTALGAACLQVSEDAADPELREVAGQAHASLLRVKGHASAGDLLGAAADEAVRPARLHFCFAECDVDKP